MVKNERGQCIFSFGSGDILISSGEYDGKGLIIFENQEAHKIGSPSDRNMPYKIDLEHNEGIPAYMLFAKLESIDALIAELENTKKIMEGMENTKKDGMYMCEPTEIIGEGEVIPWEDMDIFN